MALLGRLAASGHPSTLGVLGVGLQQVFRSMIQELLCAQLLADAVDGVLIINDIMDNSRGLQQRRHRSERCNLEALDGIIV